MKSFFSRLKEIWSRLSWLDIACSAIVALGLLVGLLGINGKVSSFLEFLAVVAGIYLVVRFVGWWRSRLLWSLRNRLIVAYFFILVVPAARILYSQLGAYLLYEDIHQRIEMIADIAQHIAIAHRTLPASINENESERILAEQSHAVHDGELPNLEIEFSSDLSLLQKLASQGKNSFAGLLQEGDSVSEPLSLISLRMIGDSKEPRVVVLRVPVTPAFLRTIAPDLGVIQLNLMENYEWTGPPGVLYSSGDKKY